jgi:beta-lactamase class A
MKLSAVLLLFSIFTACSSLPNANSLDRPLGREREDELIFHSDDELQKQIVEIATEASGKVGVFAMILEEDRSISFNGNERFAMQSVVKVPVAMAVLALVSEGKLKLEDKIKFTADDLANPGQRSPLRDKNPKGGEASLDELIRLAISESDGSASDILTRVAGGAAAVQSYTQQLGISDMTTKWTHREFGKKWELQYENFATPEAATQVLETLWKTAENKVVNGSSAGFTAEHARLLLKYMTESNNPAGRIKGLLPKDSVVAHKTGTGGTQNGITSATNDIGIIALPNQRHVAIAVFIGDSSADQTTRDAVIAKITKSVWDTWSNFKNIPRN